MKRNFSNVYFIVGLIFGSIGFIFLLIGIITGINIEAIVNSPNSHGDVRILPYIFGGLGGLFFILGWSFVIFVMKKNATINLMISKGYYIYAKITDVYPDYSVRINGRNPFKISCVYEDPITGMFHTFTSDHVKYCPESIIGSDIKVYVDRTNFDIYYVCIDEITSRIAMH